MEEESGGSSTAFPSCFIHFQGKTGDLLKLTCHTLVKIKEYCLEWINLGEPKEIAEKIIDVVRTWPDSESDVLPTEAVDFRYHKECYFRFCDKTKVARCIKKKEKASVQSVKEQRIPKNVPLPDWRQLYPLPHQRVQPQKGEAFMSFPYSASYVKERTPM